LMMEVSGVLVGNLQNQHRFRVKFELRYYPQPRFGGKCIVYLVKDSFTISQTSRL
jgi:hypothetical protein